MESVRIGVRIIESPSIEPARQILSARVVGSSVGGVFIGTAWDCARSIEVSVYVDALDWLGGKSVLIISEDFDSLKLWLEKLGFEDFWKSTFRKSFPPHDSNTWGVKS